MRSSPADLWRDRDGLPVPSASSRVDSVFASRDHRKAAHNRRETAASFVGRRLLAAVGTRERAELVIAELENAGSYLSLEHWREERARRLRDAGCTFAEIGWSILEGEVPAAQLRDRAARRRLAELGRYWWRRSQRGAL